MWVAKRSCRLADDRSSLRALDALADINDGNKAEMAFMSLMAGAGRKNKFP